MTRLSTVSDGKTSPNASIYFIGVSDNELIQFWKHGVTEQQIRQLVIKHTLYHDFKRLSQAELIMEVLISNSDIATLIPKKHSTGCRISNTPFRLGAIYTYQKEQLNINTEATLELTASSLPDYLQARAQTIKINLLNLGL